MLLKDILEQSWTFREMRDELREKLRDELLLEGALVQLRLAMVEIMQERFPELAELAKDVVANIIDLTQLRHLLVKLVSSAHSAEQARQILLTFAQ
jgi:hypothetical protein